MNGALIKLNARWIVSPQIGGYTGARCGERSRFVLRALASGVKHLSKSVTARLEEHPDGKIFTSLPRSGQINAAQMLAGWGDGREAYDSPDAVAAPAGLTV